MYRERGDAPSYAEVRRHFDLVTRIVAERGGGIVKTIGDAVMASFHDPSEAVLAALEIQRQEASLTVRIGVHAGPAIVVNANHRLDYFGRTVNIAARLEKHSHGGDVVIAETLLNDPRLAEATKVVEIERFCASVADVDESMRLVRLKPR
jgi:adenylate cyclase